MKKVILLIAMIICIGLIKSSFAITESCQCVAFRLDDVQDYWLNNVQSRIIDTFAEKNTSVTVGIIGNYFGKDPVIVNYIKDKIQKKNFYMEIANHGWNHEHFNAYNEETQSQLLANTNSKIYNLTGITPAGFIVPYDAINDDTLVAARENNLVYMSANETADEPPYQLHNAQVYRFPETAEIGNVNDKKTDWIVYNHTKTYAQVLRGVMSYGYSVVMLHPQDFANHNALNYKNQVNETQIRELKLLIDQIRESGYRIVTIGQIPQYVTYHQKYPSWLKDVFVMYAEDEDISDNELINAIGFLKNKGFVTESQVSPDAVKYPVHQNITATVFWVGEKASSANKYISNSASEWDDKWSEHYGGIDDPKHRNGYLPAGFIPKENPFYVALPYDDFNDEGIRQADISKIYWAKEKTWSDSESIVKNKWVKIVKGNHTVYAQWEDSGPFEYDDVNYVFGLNSPKNELNHNAGIDVSPAVLDYIGLYNDKKNVVSWQFIDFVDVPDGPWKKIVTTSQIYRTGN